MCAGSTQLVGMPRGPGAARLSKSDRLPRMRWSYASSGDRFHRVHGRVLPLAAAGAPVVAKAWNTSDLPAGKTRVRLRIDGDSGATRSRFTLDQPPVIGRIAARVDRESGLVTLRAPEARDPDHSSRPPSLTWYLGDGTTEKGRTVEHHFDSGDYVVDVEATDDDGCTGERVVDLSVPVGQPTGDLSEVKWCDPLEALVRSKGESYGFWPPDVGTNPESKDAPAKVELGRRQGGGFAVAYGFEVRMRVLGNPDKCESRQVIRGRYVWETKNGNEEYRVPIRATYADDGYNEDYRFRKSGPSGKADGTSEITWLDFPGVKANDNYTNAQVKADFLDVVKGKEAPIEHTEDEEGPGETAFMRISVCAAWKPPDGTRDSDFKLHERKQPDAAFPPAAEKDRLAAKDDFSAGETTRTVTGCGQK